MSGSGSSSYHHSNGTPLPKKRKSLWSKQDGSEGKKPKKSDSSQMNMQDIQDKGGYSDVSKKMMMKMGFKAGKGLGRKQQGIVDIVPASNQRGRRGLGLVVQALETDTLVDWTSEKEPTEVESFEWLPPLEEELCPDPSWISTGLRKTDIVDENLFCRKELIEQLTRCKSVFDDLEGNELRNARARSNPYESIRGVIFQNRAAMKMANIDEMFDFMFTSPKGVTDDELLYFADVCAGPGGFSEYVLWRRGWRAKGFGFTIKGNNDFKLGNFHSTNSELFEPHYGVGGLEGTGDITVTENIEAFREFVMESTQAQGVHFVTADGGFSVEGQENIQEVLTKQLVLCQFTTALAILRRGGTFLCKVFDLFTTFNVGLIYLMRAAFKQVTIIKPVTSRPANSERYVVCTGYNDDELTIYDYFISINKKMNEMKGDPHDVNDVIPMEYLLEDEDFLDFITKSNKRIAEEQCKALSKVHAFCKDRSLKETRQVEMRERCLKKWKIPDQMRKEPMKKNPRELFAELANKKMSFHPMGLWNDVIKLDHRDKIEHIAGIYNHRCYVSGSNASNLLLSRGRSNIYLWDDSFRAWKNQNDFYISCELPRSTILEVEIVKELKGEGKGQHRENAVHVIDAFVLAGEDISDKTYTDRMRLASLFIRACDRPTRNELSRIRMKEIYRTEQIKQMFDKITMRRVKGKGGMRPCLQISPDENCFVATGLNFIKLCKEPWTMEFSRKANRKYFYNKADKESTFDCRQEMIANYEYCARNRLMWEWTPDTIVHDLQTESFSSRNLISKKLLLQHIHEQIHR